MILKADNLSKTYFNGDKSLPVFRDLSLEIEVGDLITIMGPSGAGKSTLLNILGTLDNSDTGKLEILDQDVKLLPTDKLAALRNGSIGFVFQFHHLLPDFTALENILMPARIAGHTDRKSRALELLEYVGLQDRQTHYPSQLSGGERLRVAVLRALINRPALVLADEPTGNLDLTNAKKLVELFIQINRDFGQAFVITSHNPEVAAIGKRRYNLENGVLTLVDI